MSYPDQDPTLSPRPTPPETEDVKPEWIVLTREFFDEGSIGERIFLPDLTGRRRPVTLFDRPLALVDPHGKRFGRAIEGLGFAKIKDLANIQAGRIDELKKDDAAVVIKKLQEQMRAAIISPHGRYLSHVYNRLAYPIPAAREQEQIDGVNRYLSSLTLDAKTEDRNIEIIRVLHGLDDGMQKTLKEVGKIEKYNLTRERVSQIDGGIARKLKNSKVTRYIQSYMGLPISSIGRELEFVLRRDLMGKGEFFTGILFSDAVRSELDERGIDVYNSTELLLTLDLDRLEPFTPQVKGEMVAGFRQRLDWLATQA